jgi:sugar lactone lactonase YvrE
MLNAVWTKRAIFTAALAWPLFTPTVWADVVYVSDTIDGTVSQIASSGAVSQVASGFIHPGGLASDSSGNLYVTSLNSGTISKITPNGTVSQFASGLSGAQDLAFDNSGNLYVARDSEIDKITPAGAVSPFVKPMFMRSFSNLAYGNDGNLYVADSNNGTISKIALTGTLTQFASGFNRPHGLAFDSAGNLYVSSLGDGTIQKITQAGVVSPFAAGLRFNLGLAFDSSGSLYTGNYGTLAEISRIAPDGTVSQFATAGSEPSFFAVQVPEPSSLLFLFLCALGSLRRRRRLQVASQPA